MTTAVVTGAGRGIGLAMALRPAREGHAVAVDDVDGETLAQYLQQSTVGRVRTPEDVAGFVSCLAGPDSNHMTGQPVMIDGGIVMS